MCSFRTLGEAKGGSGGSPTVGLPVNELEAPEKILCDGPATAIVVAVVVVVVVVALGVYAGDASLYVVLERYEGTSETVSVSNPHLQTFTASMHR